MSKIKLQYICNNCQKITSKWSGECLFCNKWDSIKEHKIESKLANFIKKDNIYDLKDLNISYLDHNIEEVDRIKTEISEFDKVIGGGLVAGSVLLIGGDPGVGKSTLLLQILDKLAAKKQKVIYFSGEESLQQIKIRAKRLEINNDNIAISNQVEVGSIANYLRKNQDINLVVIDSIQTTFVQEIGSFPGNSNQLRSSALEFVDLAKNLNMIFILIGHITKDGQIAGPKLIEHMVDVVLYFEGEKDSNLRIIRSYKNRYGATNQLGIFDMRKEGLISIDNPSCFFLENYNGKTSGTALFPLREGNRTILLELQSLICKSYMNNPKRAVVGWDNNRLSIILAILSKHSKLDLSQYEVYFNVIGGIKVQDPASDLASAAAIIAAAKDIIIAKDTIILGELGLSGEVRSVSFLEERIFEVEKLGYKKAILPKNSKKNKLFKNMQILEIEHINQLEEVI